MRARAHVEELRGGKTAIIVSELPYGVKKGGDSGVIKKIADLVNDKVISEISDVKDLSDKTGMRIQIDLKREAIPQVVLNKLYKHTALQATWGYNAVALVDGVPRTLALRDLLSHYLDFQREVVTRRLKYELRKAEARAHVLLGYLIALDNLDAVIALIRNAADADAAREGLMKEFELSEIQAQAILDLRLRRRAVAERLARRCDRISGGRWRPVGHPRSGDEAGLHDPGGFALPCRRSGRAVGGPARAPCAGHRDRHRPGARRGRHRPCRRGGRGARVGGDGDHRLRGLGARRGFQVGLDASCASRLLRGVPPAGG